jgi:hypothetical protein
MGACIHCFSYDTELFRGEHGHAMARCRECGEEWGPFVSPHDCPGLFDDDPERQSGLGDFF